MSDLSERIKRLRALLEAATSGPWYAERDSVGWTVRSRTGGRGGADCEVAVEDSVAGTDATLIVAMRNALPALLDVAEVAERLADEIERRTAHDEWRAAGSRGMSAPFHGDLAGAPPSVMGTLRRWLRDLRKAQGGEL